MNSPFRIVRVHNEDGSTSYRVSATSEDYSISNYGTFNTLEEAESLLIQLEQGLML